MAKKKKSSQVQNQVQVQNQNEFDNVELANEFYIEGKQQVENRKKRNKQK